MNIITGQTGEPHVTSQQDREINASIFSDGNVVLPIGEKLRAELINTNTVRIYDGMLVMQGCCASLDAGAHEDLTIDSLTTGTSRIDLICAKYSKDAETGYEDVTLEVIQGDTDGSIPSVTIGDIRNGDLIAYFPMYKVTIESASNITINALFDVVELNLTQGEKIEWQGLSNMQSGQNVLINKTLDQIAHGIKLVFSSGHRSTSPSDYNYQSFEVSKKEIELFNGKGHSFPLFGVDFGHVGVKYLYISANDDGINISGNDKNIESGTFNGITYNNLNYALRTVISY